MEKKGELISIIGLVWLFDVWRTAVGKKFF